MPESSGIPDEPLAQTVVAVAKPACIAPAPIGHKNHCQLPGSPHHFLAAYSALWLFLLGNGKTKRRAFLRFRFDPNAPPMPLHDSPADSQADPGPSILLPAVKLLKDPKDRFEVLRLNADSVVAYREEPFRRLFPAQTWMCGCLPSLRYLMAFPIKFWNT